ncbi:MAG: class I SAM-dependent methyltransferase, partial [Planctomycetota bacterium]
RVLDVACGTGEILRRLRAELPPAFLCGIDIFQGHLLRASRPVVKGDAFELPFREGSFDLVLVRHVLQAVAHPVALLKQAHRVLRDGGRIHLLVEDYAALFFDVEDDTVAEFFRDVTPRFRRKGTDLYQGRRAFRHLLEAGFRDVAVDPVLVDNQTSDRETFASIFRYWRDGYAATIAELLGVPEAEVRRRFDGMIGACLDPGRHASWLLFAIGARR